MDDTTNLAVGTVANTPGTAGLTIELSSGQGARFAAKPPYNCTVRGANELGSSVTAEIVRVTARSSDKLTVERKAEPNCVLRSIQPGDIIFDSVTEKTLKDIYAALELLIPLAQKGVANGVATLEAAGLVPASELPLMTIENPTEAAKRILEGVNETTLRFVSNTGGVSQAKVEELIEAMSLVLEHPLGHVIAGNPGGAGLWAPGGNTFSGFAWQHVTPLLIAALSTLHEVAVTLSTTPTANSYCVCTGSGITITTPGSINPSDLLVIANANALGGAAVTLKGTFTVGKPAEVTTKTLNPGETLILLANEEEGRGGVWRPISESRTLALIEALIQQTGRTFQPTGENEPTRILKNKAAPYNGPVEEHQTSSAVSQWQRLTNGGMLWTVPGAGAEPVHQVRKSNDLSTNLRYQLASDGSQQYGPGGASGSHPLDTTLIRSRPGVMATGALEATKVAGAAFNVGIGAFQGMVKGAAPTVKGGTPTAEELALEYNVGDWWGDEQDGGLWICTAKGGALGATKPGTFINTSLPDLPAEAAGLAAQSFDLAVSGAAHELETGLLYLAKVPWPRTRTIKGFTVIVTTAATAALTYGHLAVFGELAAGRMTMLGLSEDQKTQWTKAELARPKVFNEGTGKAVTIEPKGGPGVFLYVGLLAVKGTGTDPALAGSNFIGTRAQDINYGLSANEYRAARGVNPLSEETFTTMPSEIELSKSKNTAAKPAPLFWVGLE